MHIVDCTFDEHADAILAILNEAIATSTALYDYEPRTIDQMRVWFDVKIENHFPVLGLVNDDGCLVAFATYGFFRSFAGYRHTVEHSVYVHRDRRGNGYGKRVMLELIAAAETRGVHVMLGVIDAKNETSIALHEQLGFTHGGTLKQVGFKFGDWLDVVFYQRLVG